jgi:hypothetical protein
MTNSKNLNPIQGMGSSREIPDVQDLEKVIEQVMNDPEYPQNVQLGHLGRAHKVVPLANVPHEMAKLAFYEARKRMLLKFKETKTIQVPEWVQIGGDGVQALDHFIYFLSYFDSDGLFIALQNITKAIEYLEQTNEDAMHGAIDALMSTRLFLWNMLKGSM